MADIDDLFKQLGGDDSDSSLGDEDSFNNDLGFGTSRSVASSVTQEELSLAPSQFLHGDDDDDDSDEGSSTNSGDIERQQEKKREDNELSEIRELTSSQTRAVTIWRSLFFFVLFATSGVVSWSAYSLTSKEEDDNFKSQLIELYSTIEEGISTSLTSVVERVQGIGEIVTSRAEIDQWPFVSLPNFEYYTGYLGDATFLMFSPIVLDENLLDWRSYSENNPPRSVEGGIEIPYIFNVLKHPNGSTSVLPVEPGGTRPAIPLWQVSPVPSDNDVFNFNWVSEREMAGLYEASLESRTLIFSPPSTEDNKLLELLNIDTSIPHTFVLNPVWDSTDITVNSIIRGYTVSAIIWDGLLDDLLHHEEEMDVIVQNTCNSPLSYRLKGESVMFIGKGDLHNSNFDEFAHSFELMSNSTYSDGENACRYSITIFPTQELYDSIRTNDPVRLAIVTAVVLLLVVLVVIRYNQIVQRKNTMIMQAAARASAMVTSYFPSQFRDQLLENSGKTAYSAGQDNLRRFLDEDELEDEEQKENHLKSKPIADLFPDCTVMFADLVGFTAWSSVREPSQVFILLETIFRAFDSLAQRRGVFKVETVGDTYVAVTGLPEPREDHAPALARFALGCLEKVSELTVKLEKTLGPDTGDLRMRFGLHSGPVTAGILRGERSRFQLFGDTMNTAARMESTGEPGRIQVSLDTADLITSAGKGHWLVRREDKVFAKGKGEMQTYWVESRNRNGEAITTSSHCSASSVNSTLSNLSAHRAFGTSNTYTGDVTPAKLNVAKVNMLLSEKVTRLIDWNTDILQGILREIVARREATPRDPNEELADQYRREKGKSVIDEVQEIITLPEYNPVAVLRQRDPSTIELSETVTAQLYDYVLTIAALYRNNPFHNFEHASHVVQSVTKLMSRIVSPKDLGMMEVDDDDGLLDVQKASALHNHTYGITSDPLTRFACVFSALIHDVDHSGVPNTQLIKEGAKVAQIYKNKSVAEQNSVDIGLDLIMEDCYEELRDAIFPTDSEMRRFRQLVVNSVMATDIVDKDLKELRNNRWTTAFSPDQNHNSDTVNRKATIVIEHLIQASDVSHTMQHWYVYRKWNERLFFEMYKAFVEGRAETDPATAWYEGELGFFDFYIIPLARKLKDCGVFGVSSDEYLNYAKKNRQEWEVKGRQVVGEMIQKLKKVYGDVTPKGASK